MKKRDNLFNKFIKANTQANKHLYDAQFKRYRNSIVTLLRLSKKNYYSDYFKSNKNNISKTWIGIKQIISGNHINHSTPSTIFRNNATISDPKGIAESYSTYFSNVAKNISNRIPKPRGDFSDFLKDRNPIIVSLPLQLIVKKSLVS